MLSNEILSAINDVLQEHGYWKGIKDCSFDCDNKSGEIILEYRVGPQTPSTWVLKIEEYVE
jgi:hypothetical protein